MLKKIKEMMAKTKEPNNVAEVLKTEKGFKKDDEEPVTQTENVAQPEIKEEDRNLGEIIGSVIHEKFGIIYKVRSNNPDLHLGLCELKQ